MGAEVTLYNGSNEAELDAEGYLELLRDVNSVFVYVRLGLKQSERARVDLSTVKPPPPTPPIDYAGLSSDESTDDEEHVSTRLSPAMERQGYFTHTSL